MNDIDLIELITPISFSTSNSFSSNFVDSVISITKEELKIKFLDQTKYSNEFDLPKYDKIIINQYSCIFKSDTEQIAIFFPNWRVYERFIMKLTQAGMIVDGHNNSIAQCFKFSTKPIFFPNSNIPAINSSNIIFKIHCIIKLNLKSIPEENLSNYLSYIDSAISYIHEQSYLKETKWYKDHPKESISKRTVNIKSLTNFLKRNVPIEDRKFHSLISNSSKLSSSIKSVIEADSRSKKYDDGAIRLCMATAIAGHKYRSGDLDIAQKIFALAKGESGIKNDKIRIPPIIEEMQKTHMTNDFLYGTLVVIYKLHDIIRFDKSGELESISKTILDIYSKRCPEIKMWLIAHKLTVFSMFFDEYTQFFSLTFPDIWRLWQWLISLENKRIALISFFAALIFFFIPTLLNSKADSTRSIGSLWRRLIPTLELGDVLDLANYFYLSYN